MGKGDEAELGRHISELTTRLCGDQGFCGPDKFIEVKLVAPDAPDLTIIDLPGIVRTHTAGQDKAVKEQVDSLLEHFLKQERTIILAVIPVNVDIATVDILERASKVDPDGERTIGVLTKPDLVDKGGEVEVMNVLANRTKPLRHGYYMLKNRSQEELKAQQGKTVSRAEARSSEIAWLRKSQYKESDRLGVQVLQTALTELLVSQIEKALPSMQEEVDKVLAETEAELAELGSAPPPSAYGRRTAALAVIRNVVSVLRRVTAFADPGTMPYSGPLVLQKELQARKEFVEAIQNTRPGFDGENDRFDEEVTEVVNNRETVNSGVTRKSVGDVLKSEGWEKPKSVTKVGEILEFGYPEHGYTKSKIIAVQPYFRGELAQRIKEGRGRELPGFMNFDVFTAQMRQYVQLWEQPTRDFQCDVQQLLDDAASYIVQAHTSKLPRLADKLGLQLHDHVQSCAAAAKARLETLLEPENLPSTENHYLFDTINKIRNQRMEDKIKALPDQETAGHVHKDTVIAMLRSNIGNDSNESQEVQDMIDFLAACLQLVLVSKALYHTVWNMQLSIDLRFYCEHNCMDNVKVLAGVGTGSWP